MKVSVTRYHGDGVTVAAQCVVVVQMRSMFRNNIMQPYAISLYLSVRSDY